MKINNTSKQNNEIEKDNDFYYLFIDDSGSRFPDTENTETRKDGMNAFALGGILVRSDDVKVVIEKYNEFCKK
ncbi:MAG: hypothetical protein QM532_04120 [Cyanobium sp. MAG06]|nr:hypothetical protein [Cyanobium sp. MAG06]